MTSADFSVLQSAREPYSQRPKKLLRHLHTRSKSLSQVTLSPGNSDSPTMKGNSSGTNLIVTGSFGSVPLQSPQLSNGKISSRLTFTCRRFASLSGTRSETDKLASKRLQVETAGKELSAWSQNQGLSHVCNIKSTVTSSTPETSTRDSVLRQSDFSLLAEQRQSILLKTCRASAAQPPLLKSPTSLFYSIFPSRKPQASRPAFFKPPPPKVPKSEPRHTATSQHEAADLGDSCSRRAEMHADSQYNAALPNTIIIKNSSSLGLKESQLLQESNPSTPEIRSSPKNEILGSGSPSSHADEKNFIVQYKSKQVPTPGFNPHATLEEDSRPAVPEHQTPTATSRQTSTCSPSHSNTIRDLLTCELDRRRLTITLEEFKAQMSSHLSRNAGWNPDEQQLGRSGRRCLSRNSSVCSKSILVKRDQSSRDISRLNDSCSPKKKVAFAKNKMVFLYIANE